MNRLVLLICMAVGLTLVAGDLKSCVRISCEQCVIAPRVTKICPIKCSNCATADNNELPKPKAEAVISISGTGSPDKNKKEPKVAAAPIKSSRPGPLKIAPKTVIRKFTPKLSNKTSAENISDLSQKENELSENKTGNNSKEKKTAPRRNELSSDVVENNKILNNSSLDSNKTQSTMSDEEKEMLETINSALGNNNTSSEAGEKEKNKTRLAPHEKTIDTTTAGLTRGEAQFGRVARKQTISGSNVTQRPIETRHESKPHAQLNKFLNELSLPPVEEDNGEQSDLSKTTQKPRLRRVRPINPTLAPNLRNKPPVAAAVRPKPRPVKEEEYYVDEPIYDEVPLQHYLFKSPSAAASRTPPPPPPQPHDPLSTLFAPLKGTPLDPTALLSVFSPPTVATVPPTLAPSAGVDYEFYVDEPADTVIVDDVQTKNQQENHRQRIDGVGIDAKPDKDIVQQTGKQPFVNNNWKSRPLPQPLRLPQPQQQQCPKLPGLEPCISKQEADARFQQCCSPLGAGCLPLCNYDASLTSIQVAVITGQCAIAKVATVLQCASGNEDATPCCQAKGVFEVGYEHCRPYCNPLAGLPSGQTSDNYRCLSKLRDIQQCFYVTQKPNRRRN